MTTPTVDLSTLLDDLDDGTGDIGHYPCESGGDDEALHVICGARIRGMSAKPGTPLCEDCNSQFLLGVVVCPAHGGLA